MGISNSDLISLLHDQYDLNIDRLDLLDMGADANAQVYRLTAAQGLSSWFLKSCLFSLHLPGVEIPVFLIRRNIPHILSPLPTHDGQPGFRYENTSFILYPFLKGGNAMEKGMTFRQWEELGSVMRAIHDQVLPDELAASLPREEFSADHRRQAEWYMQRIQSGEMAGSPGEAVADTLHSHQQEICHLIRRADALGQKLAERRDIPRVLCHADLHKWNIFITDDGCWYVIDWDSLKLAPRECDLMYIGGNIGGDRKDANEVPAFYKGYRDYNIQPEIIAYYRFERIIEDIAEFCKQVWSEPPPAIEEYQKIAGWLDSNFHPGNEYDTACQSDIN